MHRVAITGLGCISALGHDARRHWEAARDGRDGIAGITAVAPEGLRIGIAAEVKGYDPSARFDEAQLALLDRCTQFALIAAREAATACGLDLTGNAATRTAVIVGTGIGGAGTIDTASRQVYAEGKARVHPMTMPRLITSAPASLISIEHGITGPVFALSSACASAAHAIGEAFWMVRAGRADAAIAGGAEACITYGSMLAWQALRVMDPDTCRPFSRDRLGMVMGEGAGIVVLERLDAARARGAPVLAELAGYGASADAQSMLEPSAAGAARAMRAALTDAGLDPSDIAYVNAHGTGTPANDVAETRAIHDVFGGHARRLAVSSTKSMHGHALGAAGALELVIAVSALGEGVAPPTLHLDRPDPECDLDYVPHEARPLPIAAALSNSFAFGGLNAVLAIRRAD